MNKYSLKLMQAWATHGARFLPFADAATPDLPLSRLLRLSLFQVSVGMALVLMVGTLNRVMIVELGVSASLVGLMISLPVLFAPFRALIGFRSDNHKSELGWKRVPFIWRGTMIQFGGLTIMPFALLVLAGAGHAAEVPIWVGRIAAAAAFLLVGAGVHMTQTVGLALATDLAPVESQPKVVGLMYVMLLVGMAFSALVFGAMLVDFTAGRLVQVIQTAAIVTIVLNLVALWRQEPRRPKRTLSANALPEPTFTESWSSFTSSERAVRLLWALCLGTLAFGMADILLEPYGGQVLHLTVSSTTRLTAAFAVGGLFGFGLASKVLSRGYDPFRMASIGALVGVPAFLCVILAAPLDSTPLFVFGTFAVGFAAGLFSHGTLTATMNDAPVDQRGLALGAWGAVQACAAGVAMALSSVIRDLVNSSAGAREVFPGISGAAAGYTTVYAIEIVLLCMTIAAMAPIAFRFRQPARA